jgi:hypothetical protein
MIFLLSGDEDGPAADPAVAEVVDRVAGGCQRVTGGVKHDLPLVGEGDETGEIGVGADEIRRDRDFA